MFVKQDNTNSMPKHQELNQWALGMSQLLDNTIDCATKHYDSFILTFPEYRQKVIWRNYS